MIFPIATGFRSVSSCNGSETRNLVGFKIRFSFLGKFDKQIMAWCQPPQVAIMYLQVRNISSRMGLHFQVNQPTIFGHGMAFGVWPGCRVEHYLILLYGQVIRLSKWRQQKYVASNHVYCIIHGDIRHINCETCHKHYYYSFAEGSLNKMATMSPNDQLNPHVESEALSIF